jgi:MIP family channel proteins
MALPEDLIRKMVAELIGTFMLVFVGTGAIMTAFDGVGHLSYILGFGFGLIFIVYAIGHISGAHVNPAVTLGLALTGKFPMIHVPYYWGAQVVGGLLASLVLRMLYGNVSNLGVTQVAEGYSLIDAFVLEVIATAIFLFVILAVATDKRADAAVAGLAIGGTLLVIQVFAGQVSGGSVNPARSLAPALVSGTFGDLWIYLTAPFIGAAIGAVAYEFVRGPETLAQDRDGADTMSPSQATVPPRQSQRSRQRPPVDTDPAARAPQRRAPQRPATYDPDIEPTLYDEDYPQPQRPAQRPAQQQRPQADPNAPQRPPQQQQRRRPPQQ